MQEHIHSLKSGIRFQFSILVVWGIFASLVWLESSSSAVVTVVQVQLHRAGFVKLDLLFVWLGFF